MEETHGTSKTFDGPAGNNYAELTIAREREREDAIKRGLIDDPDKPKALEDAQVFRGTCIDMCPLYEREQREYQNDVKRWEINQTTGRIDKELAVKAFHRPAAGNEQALPSDVRPPHILSKTLDYLIDQVVSASDLLDKDTHGFVRDRTRSIRQDFTLQNERGQEAIACHERIVRFHILSLHQMCEIDGFDAHQEMEQLRKTLQSLAEYYDDQREHNLQCPNEWEFRAYHILTRLRDPDVLRHVQTLPCHVRTHAAVRRALMLYKYAQRNNEEIGRFKPPNCEGSHNAYAAFFRAILDSKTSYTMACLCETQFNEVRKGALKSMKKAFIAAVKAPRVDELVEILGCDDAWEVETQCEQHGIVVRPDEAGIPRPILNKTTPFDESRPDLRQRFSEKLVESKRGDLSFADIINGRTFPVSPIRASTLSPASARRRISSNMITKDDGPSIFPVDMQSAYTVTSRPSLALSDLNHGSITSRTPSNHAIRPLETVTELRKAEADQPALNGASRRLDSQELDMKSKSSKDELPFDKGTLIQEVSTRILDRLLHEEVQAVVAQSTEGQIQARQETAKLVVELSSTLVTDLIRNQLHDAVQDRYAILCYERRAKRRAWRKLRWIAKQREIAALIEREREAAEIRRQAEYDAAFETLQQDFTSRRRVKRQRVGRHAPASTASVTKARSMANQFWQPFDLLSLFKHVKLAESATTWRMVIALSAAPSKQWLSSKFDLQSHSQSRMQRIDKVDFIVDLVEIETQASLDSVGTLIFECTNNQEDDRSRFLRLLQRIAEESDYRFSVLILCFYAIDDEEALAHALMIPEIMADKKTPVTACHFFAMKRMEDIASFEEILTQALQDTSTTLSPLGLDRAAAREREERCQPDISVLEKTPSRVKLSTRPRNSFYDYRVLLPVTPDSLKSTTMSKPEDVIPKQIKDLMASVERAKNLLATL